MPLEGVIRKLRLVALRTLMVSSGIYSYVTKCFDEFDP